MIMMLSCVSAKDNGIHSKSKQTHSERERGLEDLAPRFPPILLLLFLFKRNYHHDRHFELSYLVDFEELLLPQEVGSESRGNSNRGN